MKSLRFHSITVALFACTLSIRAQVSGVIVDKTMCK